MKKLARILMSFICVGCVFGCGKDVDRTGSVVDSVQYLNDLESATISMKFKIDVPSIDTKLNYDIIMKGNDDGVLYTEMEMLGETTKYYSVSENGQTCEIVYLTEDDMEEEGWYGSCTEDEEAEEEDSEDLMYEGFTDEDFIYQDGWYTLKEEKVSQLISGLVTEDLGEFNSLIDLSSVQDLDFKVQLANGKLETIKMIFSMSEAEIKMNYVVTIKFSKINKTKIKVPNYKNLDE